MNPVAQESEIIILDILLGLDMAELLRLLDQPPHYNFHHSRKRQNMISPEVWSIIVPR